jgi:hypothetical protein
MRIVSNTEPRKSKTLLRASLPQFRPEQMRNLLQLDDRSRIIDDLRRKTRPIALDHFGHRPGRAKSEIAVLQHLCQPGPESRQPAVSGLAKVIIKYVDPDQLPTLLGSSGSDQGPSIMALANEQGVAAVFRHIEASDISQRQIDAKSIQLRREPAVPDTRARVVPILLRRNKYCNFHPNSALTSMARCAAEAGGDKWAVLSSGAAT